jgi:hypothetical protein
MIPKDPTQRTERAGSFGIMKGALSDRHVGAGDAPYRGT